MDISPLSWLGVPAAGYLLAAAALFGLQERLVFPAPRMMVDPPQGWELPGQPTTVISGGLALSGWHLPGGEGRPTALFFNGNNANLSMAKPYARLLRALDWGVMLFDPRGYGLSPGVPSEEGFYQDAEAVRAHLIHALGADPERLVYFGVSLGGGSALWLAERHPPRAVILEGTFTSLPDVAAERFPIFPIRWMSRIHFPNEQRIARVDRPVLLIHSQDDEVVPYPHAGRLLAAAAGPKRLITSRGGHNQGPHISPPGLAEALRELTDGGLP
ncbi:MAG: alpha/beta hydrolase [Magnetococcales bacterium]|nr:alpha/beta hydrolase [Magnetococcales bacterium]